MPNFTVTAFRWSGTGYGAQYNTSYSAEFTDDDDFLDGGSDANEMVSIDGGAAGSTLGPPYDININYTDVNGDPQPAETFYFFYTGGSWYFIPGPGSGFTVGATLGFYQSHTSTPTDYSVITCFVRGTLIQTDSGPVPVQDLQPGCRIETADGEFKDLRQPMSRKLSVLDIRRNPKLAPVRIMAGSLGNGMPRRDLLVSRQHRVLVSSKVCERMFGQTSVLVAANKLTALPGIFVDHEQAGVEYFHLLFDRHEIVFAEGVPTESFFLGHEALKSITPEAREEILALFPEVGKADYVPEPAFHIPSNQRQRKLVARHLKNSLSLL